MRKLHTYRIPSTAIPTIESKNGTKTPIKSSPITRTPRTVSFRIVRHKETNGISVIYGKSVFRYLRLRVQGPSGKLLYGFTSVFLKNLKQNVGEGDDTATCAVWNVKEQLHLYCSTMSLSVTK